MNTQSVELQKTEIKAIPIFISRAFQVENWWLVSEIVHTSLYLLRTSDACPDNAVPFLSSANVSICFSFELTNSSAVLLLHRLKVHYNILKKKSNSGTPQRPTTSSRVVHLMWVIAHFVLHNDNATKQVMCFKYLRYSFTFFRVRTHSRMRWALSLLNFDCIRLYSHQSIWLPILKNSCLDLKFCWFDSKLKYVMSFFPWSLILGLFGLHVVKPSHFRIYLGYNPF